MIITNRVSIGKFRATISTLGSRRIRPRPAFIAGLPGGILLPATTLALAVSRWGHARQDWLAVRAFKSGMAPIVIGLLVATGWILTAQTPGWTHVLLTIVTAVLAWRTRLHVLVMIAAGGVLGALGFV